MSVKQSVFETNKSALNGGGNREEIMDVDSPESKVGAENDLNGGGERDNSFGSFGRSMQFDPFLRTRNVPFHIAE